MAVTIQSGVDSTLLTVDSASKAARVSTYDNRGQYTGQKSTYSVCTTAKTATYNGTGVFFSLYGSATKTIRIQKIYVSATVATAAIYADIVVNKRVTAAVSGGTSTTLTPVAHDSTSSVSTATNVKIYTVAPTPGTGGGSIASMMAFSPITGTPANSVGQFDFNYMCRTEAEAIVLEGTSEGIELNFATSPGNIPTVTVWVVFTEE